MILGLVFILGFSILIFRWRIFSFEKLSIHYIILLFIVKTIAGYLSFIYHDVYFAGGDSIIYLKGGLDLLAFSQGNPIEYFKLFFNLNRDIPEYQMIYDQIMYWDSKSSFNVINDNRNAIRFNSLISLISFNSIYAHIAALNFMSLIGLTLLYKALRPYFLEMPNFIFFMAIFLSPSILFWTSGILKETHALLFIGLYIYSFSTILKNPTIINFFAIILFAFLLLLSRSYFAIILFFSSFTYLSLEFIRQRKGYKKWISIVLLTILSVLAIKIVNGPLFKILSLKQIDFNHIGQNANSYFEISRLEKPLDLILLFPEALINVLVQPQLFSWESWLYSFSIIENIDIIFFIVIGIVFYKKPKRNMHSILFALLLTYILSSWLIGLTIPVQGAIARYKSISYPFLLLFIFSIIDWGKIQNKYSIFPQTEDHIRY